MTDRTLMTGESIELMDKLLAKDSKAHPDRKNTQIDREWLLEQHNIQCNGHSSDNPYGCEYYGSTLTSAGKLQKVGLNLFRIEQIQKENKELWEDAHRQKRYTWYRLNLWDRACRLFKCKTLQDGNGSFKGLTYFNTMERKVLMTRGLKVQPYPIDPTYDINVIKGILLAEGEKQLDEQTLVDLYKIMGKIK